MAKLGRQVAAAVGETEQGDFFDHAEAMVVEVPGNRLVGHVDHETTHQRSARRVHQHGQDDGVDLLLPHRWPHDGEPLLLIRR
jgi:hypothetical protein